MNLLKRRARASEPIRSSRQVQGAPTKHSCRPQDGACTRHQQGLPSPGRLQFWLALWIPPSAILLALLCLRSATQSALAIAECPTAQLSASSRQQVPSSAIVVQEVPAQAYSEATLREVTRCVLLTWPPKERQDLEAPGDVLKPRLRHHHRRPHRPPRLRAREAQRKLVCDLKGRLHPRQSLRLCQCFEDQLCVEVLPWDPGDQPVHRCPRQLQWAEWHLQPWLTPELVQPPPWAGSRQWQLCTQCCRRVWVQFWRLRHTGLPPIDRHCCPRLCWLLHCQPSLHLLQQDQRQASRLRLLRRGLSEDGLSRFTYDLYDQQGSAVLGVDALLCPVRRLSTFEQAGRPNGSLDQLSSHTGRGKHQHLPSVCCASLVLLGRPWSERCYRVIASVLCSAQVCDMVLPLRQLRSGCHIASSLHAVLASQVRPLEHHAGTLPRQGPCRHSVTASRHTRQTLHVQVSLHGPTLLQTPPASYLGARRLLPEATLLLAVRPDWRSVPTGVLSAHGLQRHSSNSQPSWPFFAVSVALPWLPSMPKPMRATRRHASADDLVEVEIEAAADEAAALISERQACASGSEIVLDPLAAGTEAVVVAGHRPELVGVRVMILRSTDLTSRNVRPLQGLQVQKMRTYTVDVQHLQSCTGLVADQDDGLHPSLRWRLHPPPLTLYSARWLLGWSSYATLVPPAAPKRDRSHGRGIGIPTLVVPSTTTR